MKPTNAAIRQFIVAYFNDPFIRHRREVYKIK